jgi:hypothetical protein
MQKEKRKKEKGANSPGKRPTLELPVDADFHSRPPQIDPPVMLARIAENIAWRNSRPGEAERRAAEKMPVEFVL